MPFLKNIDKKHLESNSKIPRTWFLNILRYVFHTNPKQIYLRTLFYVNPLFNLCVSKAGINKCHTDIDFSAVNMTAFEEIS